MPRVTITVPERTPQPYRFQLDRMKVNMGRGSENDIVIDCGSVSVRHAVMERIEGGYQLRDLGSTNGIKLDGVAREIIPLRHGLSVRIGDVAFDFTLTEDEREALSREKPMEESPIVREEYTGPPSKRVAARPGPAVHRPLGSAMQQPSAAANFGMVLLFMLLSAGAFFAGLYIRYSQENDGKSLIEAIAKKGSPATEEAPAEPAAEPAE
ncbi:FHA domain-containing protein [Luteolibacter marinus]|uniref:FHA domain-containing protein n=1 Tax=Luteolibacter marinus TaxID=2776705 RepID=UPI0018667F76|nr:FHA domain-containing protein [Luteolibacter marinus]